MVQPGCTQCSHRALGRSWQWHVRIPGKVGLTVHHILIDHREDCTGAIVVALDAAESSCHHTMAFGVLLSLDPGCLYGDASISQTSPSYCFSLFSLFALSRTELLHGLVWLCYFQIFVNFSNPCCYPHL
jgi:hypothetical protein